MRSNSSSSSETVSKTGEGMFERKSKMRNEISDWTVAVIHSFVRLTVRSREKCFRTERRLLSLGINKFPKRKQRSSKSFSRNVRCCLITNQRNFTRSCNWKLRLCANEIFCRHGGKHNSADSFEISVIMCVCGKLWI